VFVSTEGASDMQRLALNCLQTLHKGLEREREECRISVKLLGAYIETNGTAHLHLKQKQAYRGQL
jgi:hypothetical protein